MAGLLFNQTVQIKLVKENARRPSHEKFGKGEDDDTNYRTTSLEKRCGWSERRDERPFSSIFPYSTRDLRG